MDEKDAEIAAGASPVSDSGPVIAVPPQRPAQRFDRSIVEGPIGPAVWRLAWPTMLQNIIAGLQGIIDHVMVGNFVGYTANAAIGVSWQIIIVVIVFISSLFTGMGVLVARFAGANEPEKVNRVVYQGFLTAIALAAVMAIVGYFAAPALLNVVNAAPEVQRQALPFLRAMFLGIFGLLLFFMLSGAFRAAGDTRTAAATRRVMTVLTIVFNILLIPALGTLGAAWAPLPAARSSPSMACGDSSPGLGHSLPPRHGHSRRTWHHPIALPFRVADWRPGHRDEHRRACWCCGSSDRSSTAPPHRRPTRSAIRSCSRSSPGRQSA